MVPEPDVRCEYCRLEGAVRWEGYLGGRVALCPTHMRARLAYWYDGPVFREVKADEEWEDGPDPRSSGSNPPVRP